MVSSSQKYFPSLLTSTLIGKDKRHRADKARKILVQEYFSSALRVPELEGFLHLKDGYKSKWKKVYFILRASGLYHTIKGTKKVSCLDATVDYSHLPSLSSRRPRIFSFSAISVTVTFIEEPTSRRF